MTDFSLEERFPEMKPISSPPSLSTVNGMGLMAYGSRDHDPLTNTYVKTHCLCLLFFPIVALGAYRVADAPGGGWYFLGKVPLSRLARFWNCLILGGIACGIGLFFWFRHIGSPEYLARQQLEQAAELAEAKQIGKAAQLYARVANGPTTYTRQAVEKVSALLDAPPEGVTPEEAAEALRVAIALHEKWADVLPALYERGVHLANRYAAEQPRGALALLDLLAPVAPDLTRLAEQQAPVLEKLVAAEPDSVEYASRLAQAYEVRKQLDRCEKLLAPHAGKLGDSEGARVLALVRIRQGNLDEAERLLTAYTEPRLEKRQQLARDLQQAQQLLEDRALQDLRTGKIANFDYARFKRAGPDERRKMLHHFLLNQVKDDAAVRTARAALERERNVVGAALDLGMVLIQRAQGLKGEARTAALVKAEKTFLALRGAAGPGEEVTINLGEVYYWLGKQGEGKVVLDKLLRDRGRDPRVLLRVSSALRRVGEGSEARRLAEEAFERSTTPEAKETAADLRAALATELDDRITWLKRSNTQDPLIQADLSAALGQKAVQENNEDEAIRHFREAAAGYDRLPLNAATLNNGALVHSQLYRLSGDREDFLRASRMMDRALAQHPGDSILLRNSAAFALEGAVHEVVGPSLDLKVLRGLSGLSLLPYLYTDQAGRDQLAARLRAHPAFARSVQQQERLLVLAPRNVLGPASLAMLYTTVQDVPALRKLEEQMRKVELDLERSTKETLETYQGKNQERMRTEYKGRLAQRRKALEAARKLGGATQAAAVAELVLEMGRADGLGLPLDPNELIRLAEEADRAAPSHGTRLQLIGALITRAGRTLAASNKTYAAWVARSRRALGHGSLLALALSESGPLRDAVRKNPDMRRAMDLERKAVQAFPGESNPWAWALLRDAYPDEAARLVKLLSSDETGRLLEVLGKKLSPLSAQGAVTQFWTCRMMGNEAEARAVLRRAAARGIPLPFDVP
jgi:hypothetical protein